jgi:hypothetical protein
LYSSLLLLAPTPGNAIAFLRDASRTSKLPQLSLICGGIIPIPLLVSFLESSSTPNLSKEATALFFLFWVWDRGYNHRVYSEGKGANRLIKERK